MLSVSSILAASVGFVVLCLFPRRLCSTHLWKHEGIKSGEQGHVFPHVPFLCILKILVPKDSIIKRIQRCLVFLFLLWPGVATMPAVCLGIFFSGIIMKRFKLDMVGAAKVAFWTSIGGFLCTIPYFALSCKNTDVAGVTVPYPGYRNARWHAYQTLALNQLEWFQALAL